MIAAELTPSASAGSKRWERESRSRPGRPDSAAPTAMHQRLAAADRRQPAEFHGKGQHQQDAEPVDRHRHAELGKQHGRRIDRRALLHRGDDAESDADDDRDVKGGDGEFDRRAEAARAMISDTGWFWKIERPRSPCSRLGEVASEPDDTRAGRARASRAAARCRPAKPPARAAPRPDRRE